MLLLSSRGVVTVVRDSFTSRIDCTLDGVGDLS